MTKAPKQPPEPETHQEPPQPEPQPVSMASPVPAYEDPTSDANLISIITSQRALQASLLTQANYLQGLMTTQPPLVAGNPNLQAISDAYAGITRALGAYCAQLDVVLTLWPPGSTTTGSLQ